LNAEVLRHGFTTGDATLVRPATETKAGFSEVEHMRNSISRTIVAGLAALAMSAAVILPATPASAAYRFGGGGWAGGRVWHPGYWRGGYWSNGWWAPAVAAGLLTGAAIATYPAWGYGYGPAWGYGYGRGGCWQYRPIYDGYGNSLGQRWVRLC
jgi:hypothetical protein